MILSRAHYQFLWHMVFLLFASRHPAAWTCNGDGLVPAETNPPIALGNAGEIAQTIPKKIGRRAQPLDPQWWARVRGRNFLETGKRCFTQSVVTYSDGESADAERLVVDGLRRRVCGRDVEADPASRHLPVLRPGSQ